MRYLLPGARPSQCWIWTRHLGRPAACAAAAAAAAAEVAAAALGAWRVDERRGVGAVAAVSAGGEGIRVLLSGLMGRFEVGDCSGGRGM